MCKKCDDIITCAGSGHHLRPDRTEPSAPYFGKSERDSKLSLSDIPIRNNQAASDRASAEAKAPGKDFPKYGAPGSIPSGRKWWPLPAHVMMSSHFLHNEVKSASNFIVIFSLVVKLLKKCRVR